MNQQIPQSSIASLTHQTSQMQIQSGQQHPHQQHPQSAINNRNVIGMSPLTAGAAVASSPHQQQYPITSSAASSYPSSLQSPSTSLPTNHSPITQYHAQSMVQQQAQTPTNGHILSSPAAAPPSASFSLASNNAYARSSDSSTHPYQHATYTPSAYTATPLQDTPLSYGYDAHTNGNAYDMHDPTVSSTCEYLSSYAVPNSIALSNSSPLPHGILLSPCTHLHPAPPRFFGVRLQQCGKCRAYVNMYGRLSQSINTAAPSSAIYTCAFCRTSQDFRSEINQYVDTSSATPDPHQPQQHPAAVLPVELAYKVLESVSPRTQNAAILPPTVFPASARLSASSPATGVASQPSFMHPRSTGAGINYIFIIDHHFSVIDFSQLRSSLNTLLLELPPEAGISLMSFSHVVTIYDLTQSGVASSHVMSGDISPSLEDVEEWIREYGVSFPRVEDVRDTFSAVLDAIEQTKADLTASLSVEEQQNLFQLRAIGAAAEWALARVQAGREYDELKTSAANQSSRSSSSIAVSSSPIPSFAFTHVLLFTSGPPDYGPGTTLTSSVSASATNSSALSYYTALSQRCNTAHTQVDYVVQGMNQFGVQFMRKLVDPTGGSVWMYQSFGNGMNGSAVTANGATPQTSSSSPLPPLQSTSNFLSDLRQILFRPVGYDAHVDVYYSSGLKITRVVGGVMKISEENDQDETTKQNHHPSVSHLRLHLSHCRPDTSLSLYYALKDDLPDDYIFLQFVVQWKDWNHQRVTRITTRRLRTTGNATTFLRSIDNKIVNLLLAKRLVLLAMNGQQSEAEGKEDIDSQIRDTCRHFDERRLSSSSASSSPQLPILPEELSSLPLFLYHLRRSPLLITSSQNSDDTEILRGIFLQSNRADSWRMILPQLMSFDRNGMLEELPMSTLALQSSRILYLDRHTQILLWSGALVTSPLYEAYRRAFYERAHTQGQWRLPRAEMIAANEYTGDARWLQVRLAPSHKDEETEQMRSFPQLLALSPLERQELTQKMFPTDELSFTQYFTSLFHRK